jgi:protein involved in polysaccharide export with SLBB domain
MTRIITPSLPQPFIRSALCLTTLLAGVLPAGMHAQQPANGAVILVPGDALRISVWRNEPLSGEFRVSNDGTLAHPLYRTVKVAGVPLGELEERFGTFLSKYEANPQFVVEPLLRVAVGGEVARSDLYMLSPATTIAQAVAIAGGATPRGRRDRVMVIRNNQERTVHLTGPEGREGHMPIQSGDILLVEERSTVFRDVIAPIIGFVGASAAVLNVIINRR